jgi:mono/diheme cytochrome c family protein
MKMKAIAVSMALFGSFVLAESIHAADKGTTDPGRREFMNRCAICHGQSAKGDGGVTEWLKVAPSDLTTLSKKNGGVFPYDRVYQVIDGREIVKGHGTRDMPIWGARYVNEGVAAAEYYVDVPYDMEMFARSRILSLIDFVYRIQVK